MEGPEKVDETTPIEINRESKVVKGGMKNSLRKVTKPLGYCARFFQSLFVRFLYWFAFGSLIGTFYPRLSLAKNADSLNSSGSEISDMIGICMICSGVALFAEFIYRAGKPFEI